MTTQQIGLIIGVTTRKLFAVLNPNEDADFDNPRYLLTFKGDLRLDEDVTMIRVERDAFEMATTMDEVDLVVDAYFGDRLQRNGVVRAAYSQEPLIGMVVGTTSRILCTLTNPTSNHELDNPRLLLFQLPEPEPVMMVIIPRGTSGEEMMPDEVQARIDHWYAEQAMSEAPYDGPDYVST